jgi:predicted Zn-dependent protease
MKTGFLYRTILVLVSLMPAAASALGQTERAPLDEKENPLLIGKRDLNTSRINLYSPDQEVAFGRRLAKDIDRQSTFFTDPVVTEYVNRVGQNIALRSDAQGPFTIKVIDSDDVDAFALPGGNLYVSRGMIETVDSEAELAGVMAHLIGHLVAKHGFEQETINLITDTARRLFLQDDSDDTPRSVCFSLPLLFLKFSSDAEEEADRLGAQYMWASGYDAQALNSVFEKSLLWEEARPRAVARLFSAHLMAGDRVVKINRLLARFPDRLETEHYPFEFGAIKAHLVASRAEKPQANPQSSRLTLRRH